MDPIILYRRDGTLQDEEEIARWTTALRRAEKECSACRTDRPVIR